MEEIKSDKDPSKINLRSEEITEILGIPPKWIVRWGITVILIVVAIIFIGSGFFRYPDIIIAPSVITSENPPSIIISKSDGKITDLMIAEGSFVKVGDTIAVIENPARLDDIRDLSRSLRSFDPSEKAGVIITGFSNHNNLNLGEIQNQYNSFSKAFKEYQIFIKQDYHENKIRALESEKLKYNQYYRRLMALRDLTERESDLAGKQFKRDSGLFVSNVIPVVEYERSLSTLLAKYQQLENARLDMTNTTLTIDRLNQSILDLRFEQETRTNTLKEELVNSYNQLVSSLASWEKKYLLIAPSSGRLTYMDVWSNLQEVKSGDPLFTINPEERGKVFASVIIPFRGIGKVKTGERVNIKLDGYPYMEFGVVEGTIQTVSSGSKEEGFPAVVHLTKGAVTSYGHELSFERDLSGLAEITTEEMTLLKRFFNPFRYLVSNKIINKY